MDIYASEEEQVEALKKWWQENGKAVIAGAIIGISAVLGWRAWIGYQESKAIEASVHYERFVASIGKKSYEVAGKQAEQLKNDYGSTPYSWLAALFMATAKIEQGQYPAADGYLRWVMANSSTAQVQNIARLRLARVLLTQSKYDDALALLVIEQVAFIDLYQELLGDIYVAKGETAKARNAYQKALLVRKGESSTIQLKLDDLGTPVVRVD